MPGVIRFGVAMDQRLLNGFDQLIAKKGYNNRSKAISDLVRKTIVEEDWRCSDKETVGTITIVYSHHVRELADMLTQLQHNYHKEIISCMHVHLNAHNCLEVLAVQGSVNRIKKIADLVISTRGVKHGKLVMTTSGKHL